MLNIIKKFKEFNQNRKDKYDLKVKKEMCERAIKTGVCPNSCYRCVWNIIRGCENE